MQHEHRHVHCVNNYKCAICAIAKMLRVTYARMHVRKQRVIRRTHALPETCIVRLGLMLNVLASSIMSNSHIINYNWVSIKT